MVAAHLLRAICRYEGRDAGGLAGSTFWRIRTQEPRRGMEGTIPPKKVLIHQSIGFVAIIALSWVNESLDLRSLILGDHPYISDFRESTLEMLFVLAVWLIIAGSTRRL